MLTSRNDDPPKNQKTWSEARSVRDVSTNNFLNSGKTKTGLALARLSYEIRIEDDPAGVQSVDANALTPALDHVVEANSHPTNTRGPSTKRNLIYSQVLI